MNSNIYILREQIVRDASGTNSPVDYSPALDHGDSLSVVTRYEADQVIGGSEMAKNMVEDLRSFAMAYNPDKDYIIPTGAPTMILLVGMLLHAAGHRRVRMLKWSPRDRRYRKIVWDLEDL
jgi:hypothetical protein